MEGDGAAVLRNLDAFRNQSVECERLVAAARHQALVHVLANVTGGHAPDDESIEAVEGAERTQHEPAALRGGGIGIGKMLEPRRMLRRSMHGDGVHRLGLNRGAEVQANEEECDS